MKLDRSEIILQEKVGTDHRGNSVFLIKTLGGANLICSVDPYGTVSVLGTGAHRGFAKSQAETKSSIKWDPASALFKNEEMAAIQQDHHDSKPHKHFNLASYFSKKMGRIMSKENPSYEDKLLMLMLKEAAMKHYKMCGLDAKSSKDEHEKQMKYHKEVDDSYQPPYDDQLLTDSYNNKIEIQDNNAMVLGRDSDGKLIVVHYPEKESTNEHLMKAERLQKNVKTMKEMLGPELTPEHKEHIEWAKKLPNSNWQVWATRGYKKNPWEFGDYVPAIEHFAGSQHIPEVAAVRFDKTHDLESGYNLLVDAENKYNERIKKQKNLVYAGKQGYQEAPKMHIPGKNGRNWYDLQTMSCTAEGKAMGHCGNSATDDADDEVFSLRTPHFINGQEYHEPHLTFIYNKGYLGEMKGRGNEKPTEEYHDDIVELLKNPKTKGILGGGYKPQNNFAFEDLSPERQQEVLKANPNLFIAGTKDKKAQEAFLSNPWPRHAHSLAFHLYRENAHTLSPETVDKILSRDARAEDSVSLNQLQSNVAKYSKLNFNQQNKIADSEDSSLLSGLYRNKKLDNRIIEKAINQDHEKLAHSIALPYLAQNPTISEQHMEKLANTSNPFILEGLGYNPNLPESVQDKILNRGDLKEHGLTLTALASNPNLSEKNVYRLFNLYKTHHGSDMMKHLMINPKVNKKMLDDVIDHSQDGNELMGAASNPKTTPEKILQKLSSPDLSKDARLAIFNGLIRLSTDQMHPVPPILYDSIKEYGNQSVLNYLSHYDSGFSKWLTNTGGSREQK